MEARRVLHHPQARPRRPRRRHERAVRAAQDVVCADPGLQSEQARLLPHPRAARLACTRTPNRTARDAQPEVASEAARDAARAEPAAEEEEEDGDEGDEEAEGEGVEIACPRCRETGHVEFAEWEEGVRASESIIV